MGIEGVPTPETIIEKTSSSPSDAADTATDSASSLSDKATEKATEAATGGVKSVISEAAEAVKTALADSDGDGQEHNEL